MSPADQIQLVLLEEGTHDLLPEHIADSSLRLPPHLDAALRVSPQQVAEQASVRDVGGSDYGVDLLDSSEFWRESPVHTEYPIFYKCGDRHAVEAIHEALPEFDIVSTFA